jgi:hypothetical protein
VRLQQDFPGCGWEELAPPVLVLRTGSRGWPPATIDPSMVVRASPVIKPGDWAIVTFGPREPVAPHAHRYGVVSRMRYNRSKG